MPQNAKITLLSFQYNMISTIKISEYFRKCKIAMMRISRSRRKFRTKWQLYSVKLNTSSLPSYTWSWLTVLSAPRINRDKDQVPRLLLFVFVGLFLSFVGFYKYIHENLKIFQLTS